MTISTFPTGIYFETHIEILKIESMGRVLNIHSSPFGALNMTNTAGGLPAWHRDYVTA